MPHAYWVLCIMFTFMSFHSVFAFLYLIYICFLKLHDIDKALSVDSVYPNLNLSELGSAKVDSGNLLASKTHMPFDNLE